MAARREKEEKKRQVAGGFPSGTWWHIIDFNFSERGGKIRRVVQEGYSPVRAQYKMKREKMKKKKKRGRHRENLKSFAFIFLRSISLYLF